MEAVHHSMKDTGEKSTRPSTGKKDSLVATIKPRNKVHIPSKDAS